MTTATTNSELGLDLLTNSSEQAFMACPRLYYWAYERLWRPERSKRALRMGSAGHVGVDALARGKTTADALDAIAVLYEGHKADAAGWMDASAALHDLDIECVTIQCLVEGYAGAWANSRIEIIESEKSFNLPIINPATGAASRTFRQAGKRDRIGRLPDGRIVLMETKFVSDDICTDSDYWRVLGLNQQISKYILAARAEGIDVESAMQDVIRKPTIKPTDVPEIDADGIAIVRDIEGNRVKNKNGAWRQTADDAKGYTLRKFPMTPDQWRAKLAADIADRPEYYYARKEIPRLDTDLDEYQAELWWLTEAIRHCRNTGHWFRNSGACKRFNSLCPYHALCAREVDVSGGVPAGFRQADNAHPELNEPDEEGAA